MGELSADGQVEQLEKVLKDFNLEEDHFLKDLDEYTEIAGTVNDKVNEVLCEKIQRWMMKWNICSLGDIVEGYDEKRKEADEIYEILCIPEMESLYLKNMAVDDLILFIEKLNELYVLYPNPELLEEMASKYNELGNHCQRIGRSEEAGDYYLLAIDKAWKGVEESIKYGMKKNVKRLFDDMIDSYAGLEVLTDDFEDWDRERAKIIKESLNNLKDKMDEIIVIEIET